jgi:hypothetical protein
MVADVIVFVFSTLKMGTQNPFGNVVTPFFAFSHTP